METLFAAIPVVIFLGMIGVAWFCWRVDVNYKKKTGRTPTYHPDRDMPLYNNGHCDRYSAGNFYW